LDERRCFLFFVDLVELFELLLNFRLFALSIGLGVCVTPVGGDTRNGLGIISVDRDRDRVFGAEEIWKGGAFVKNELSVSIGDAFSLFATSEYTVVVSGVASSAFVFSERNSKMTGIVNIITTMIAKTIATTFSAVKKLSLIYTCCEYFMATLVSSC
jgi:hypothetical protein